MEDWLAYVRFHGRDPGWAKAKSAAQRHGWEYSAKELKEIAARSRNLAALVEDGHMSVNNHAGNFAPKAAMARRELLVS